MKLLIIRHAEPDYSIDSLTEKGWREAELLKQRLIKREIDFFTLPLWEEQKTLQNPPWKPWGNMLKYARG